MLLPGMVAAKKPRPVSEPGCEVLPAGDAYTGETLRVRVVRVPRYPGSWFSPTITGTASFPMPKRSAYEQTVTQTINSTGITYVDLFFNVPILDTGIRTVMDNGGGKSRQVRVDVTVSEPLSGGSVIRETSCSGSTDVLPNL
jgi:hypothetical protein